MKRTRGRAKARPSSRLLVGLALLVSLGGCRSPLDKEEASPERRPDLGEPATQLPVGDAPVSTDTSAPATGVTTTAPGQTQSTNAGQTTTTPATQPAPVSTSQGERQLRAITDVGGTSGSAPGYADTRTVTFIDTGNRVRVIVDVAAPFPAFKTRETLGIGVDIYRSSEKESDYQLFADGGINGWTAYLQTPDGFIEYPGTFAVGTTRLQFEVPWSAVGGEKSFRTSVFADWSSRENLLPQAGGDRAPDQGVVEVATT